LLASDEDVGTLDSLRYSLAGDIVELVVLSVDEPFLQTLRDALGETQRLWHVPSSDKVSDLLLAGQVGILVLDVPALHAAAAVFIGQIKRQFPDLVVVVAGSRDDETSLAGLISSGAVYRFIHKPMSPGRARSFADAAVRRFQEQRRRATATPPAGRTAKSNSGLWIGCALGAVALILAATWASYTGSRQDPASQRAPLAAPPQAAESPPPQQLAAAQAGIAEARERLLASAENALLEERLDDAASAIETARKAGVESSRLAFLTAQLAKSREQLKAAQAQAHAAKSEAKGGRPDEDRTAQALRLAAQRLDEGHLIEPDQDNARFYVQQALQIDADSTAAQNLEQSLALRLLTEARGAIGRRDFSNAAALLEGAVGIAAPANIEAVQQLLEGARRTAQADSVQQLLKSASDRLREDRLIQPANDSAKYYLMTVRGLDPANTGLAAAMQDLGARLVAKARQALALEQYEAARSWLDEATAIGYSSADFSSARKDLDSAVAAQRFLTNVVSASELTLLKSVQPKYPQNAERNKIQGWVELDFTVTETGEVKDIAVHGASVPGVFEEAAIAALSQWRYQPVLRDAKAAAQRARLRIRFSLST
jgi:TonB family protein